MMLLLLPLLLSLVSLSSASSPVPLLAYSSTSFPSLELLNTNQQGAALSTVLEHEDVCSFDAVIIATQEALHATHLRSAHSAIVDSYRSAANGIHLPYLTLSGSPVQQAKDVAARCNSNYLHVLPEDSANLAFDMSKKYVIYLEFPSMEDINAVTLSRQLDSFASVFPSHLVLFTGVPATKRQAPSWESSTIPAPEPTPSQPLAATSYRLLTPIMIFSFGVVFLLVIPLAYISIGALASIKSPVAMNSYKGPSTDKKTQ